MHGQFLRLVGGEPRVGPELRVFLSEGYKLKATADYEVGPDAVVPLEEAAAAIDTAASFVETVDELLEPRDENLRS